ncbi:hypothetical protein D3C78_1606430 [compost metagenome]
MSDRLNGRMLKKTELDTLYSTYSSLIHHTNSTPTDLFNFRRLAEVNTALISYILNTVVEIKEIYTLDFLVPILQRVNLDLSTKMTFNNDLQQSYKNTLLAYNII